IGRQGRRMEMDDGPIARRRALLRLALRRRLTRAGRTAAVVLAACLGALGVVSAGQESTYAPAPDYRFGPGDVLQMRIWNGEKVDEYQLTVQSDGAAVLPILGIGSRPVGGRTA